MAGEKEGNIVEQLLNDGTSKELLKLKKKLAKDITNKLGIKTFQKQIVNYLVNEGSIGDLIGDKVKESLFGEKGLNIITNQLSELRNRISAAHTKEDLEKLRSDIFKETGEKVQKTTESKETTESDNKTTTGTTTQTSSTESSSNSSNNIESEENSTIVSAKSGEAAKVPEKKEDRFSFLFPNGKPETKEEMKPYLTKIEVPIKTAEGKESNTSITVHKKLADVYKSVFQEMYDQNIPVNPKKTGAFNWRDVRGKKGKKSDHCWGGAIDLNRDVNGGAFGKTDKNSPYYNDNKTVEIRKKHGFARGGDWKKRNDPMHFTYTLG